MSTYVVVTVFDPADGKARIVHAWGPYDTRAKAQSVARRMRQRDKTDISRPSTLTYHVREVLGEEGPR